MTLHTTVSVDYHHLSASAVVYTFLDHVVVEIGRGKPPVPP